MKFCRILLTSIILCTAAMCLMLDTVGSNAGSSQESEGVWMRSEFETPSSKYRMTKLLYGFDEDHSVNIKQVAKMGYGGIVTNVPFNDDYLTDTDEIVRLGEAYKYGSENSDMTQWWIYDEYQWPSGAAGGLVIRENEEKYESKVLKMKIVKFGKQAGAVEYTQNVTSEYHEKIVYAEVVDINTNERHGVEFDDTQVNGNTEFDKWDLIVYTSAWSDQKDWRENHYINIMNEEAVSVFIKKTHEMYKKYMGNSFNIAEAFFTDEPQLLRNDSNTLIAWDDAIPQKFESLYGYSLNERLHFLFEADTDEAKKVRICYYETVGTLTAENYFKQIEDWCFANDIASSGHLLYEEKLLGHVRLYGNIMKCLNEMGIPGADVLWVEPERLLYEDSDYGGYMGIKFASSAARNTNKQYTFAEFNPTIKTDEFNKDSLLYSVGGVTLMSFWGINKFNMLNPFEDYNMTQAVKLNEYTARINTVLDKACLMSEIGVYYPVSTVQARACYAEGDTSVDSFLTRLCKALLVNQFDFNILDEDAILKASFSGTKMVVGSCSYSVIIMPKVIAMSQEAMQKLNDYVALGGTVIWLGETPSIATKGDSNELKRLVSSNLKYKYEAVIRPDGTFDLDSIKQILLSKLDYGFTFTPSTANSIMTAPYNKDGQRIYYIANMTKNAVTVEVKNDTASTYRIYDPYTGNIAEGTDSFTCEPYRGVFAVVALADYTDVNEAIERANSLDLTVCTKKSVDKLLKSIASVNMSLFSGEQNKVDSYAKAINDAIDGLELSKGNKGSVLLVCIIAGILTVCASVFTFLLVKRKKSAKV